MKSCRASIPMLARFKSDKPTLDALYALHSPLEFPFSCSTYARRAETVCISVKRMKEMNRVTCTTMSLSLVTNYSA